MKERLLEILVCPICKKSFSIKITKQDKSEIESGILHCENNHKFSVIRGIPRLVVDKTQGFVETEDAFSEKWKKLKSLYNNNKYI